jgi:hypothetical protein
MRSHFTVVQADPMMVAPGYCSHGFVIPLHAADECAASIPRLRYAIDGRDQLIDAASQSSVQDRFALNMNKRFAYIERSQMRRYDCG